MVTHQMHVVRAVAGWPWDQGRVAELVPCRKCLTPRTEAAGW